MSKIVISVLYLDAFLFYVSSQSDIDNVILYFNRGGTSHNWENSNGESVSKFLGIDIKTLDNGGFPFCQTGLIRKVLEATGMENFNELPTPTKVEAPLGTYIDGSEAKIDWPNSCVLGTFTI